MPPGLEARRQPPARRRGRARRIGRAAGRAGGSPPQHVALAAAVGLTELTVRRRVRVAVFSTGDEIVEPGTPRPRRGAVRRQPLSARRAARAARRRRHRSRHPAGRSGAACARDRGGRAGHDLVLTSGGVSTGEADHVRARGRDASARLVFWRVGIKPGRPVAMGVIPGCEARSERGLRRPARQSGRGLRHLRARGAAAAAAARRRRGARRCCRCRCARLSPIARRRAGANMCASRSCAAPTARRSGQARAGGRRRHHLADRDRRARRAVRSTHDGRAGRDRRVSLLRGADRGRRVRSARPIVVNATSTGFWTRLSTTTAPTAITTAAMQATMNARMDIPPRMLVTYHRSHYGLTAPDQALNGRIAAPRCARPRRRPRAC